MAKCIFCLLVLACCAIEAAGATLLVENGQPRALIVVAAGKNDSPAVLDLQAYVEKVSGAKLAIVTEGRLPADGSQPRVYVGPSQAAANVVSGEPLEPEGFVIKTVGRDLYIVGNDQTASGLAVDGTRYGVCEFLESQLGIRWLMPGPLGEVVPKRSSIVVGPLDIRQEPLLWQRNIRNTKQGGHQDRIEAILNDWDVPLDEWRSEFANDRTEPWFRRQRLGRRVKLSYGHAFSGWWDRYHEQYPEIFAMQPDGTRINTPERERLCVSNPQLWELVAAEKIAELRENPSLTAASISPNDGGRNQFCKCPQCRAWDAPGVQELYRRNPQLEQGPEIPLTDRYCRFYNEVARRVGAVLPDRYLGCYAYSVYRTPPAVVDRMEDNLIVGYVAFSSYTSEAMRQENRREWVAWSKIAKQLILRPNLLWGPLGMPVNYVHKLADDIRFLTERGMRATDYDGLIGNWGTQGLDYYVLAKLLWNPAADVDSIVDDYCRAAYGPGAEAMKEYYRRLEMLTDRIAAATPAKMHQFNRWNESDKLARWYTDDVLAELRASVRNAQAAIGDSDKDQRARVELVATGIDYAARTRDLLLAAAAVRAGTSDRAAFEQTEAEVLQYYRTLALSWAVAMEHNYSYIRRGLGLKAAAPPAKGDAE